MKINIETTLSDLPAPIFIFFVVMSVALIVAGRKLLWLYLGSVAFLIVYVVLPAANVSSLNETTITLIALGSGLVVSAIMFFLKSVTRVVAALVLGVNVATLFVSLFNLTDTNTNTAQNIAIFMVGLISVIIAFRYWDDALIVLSVLNGVALLTQELLRMDTNTVLTAIVWLALSLLGVIVQYAYLQREQRARQAQLAPAPATSSLPTPNLEGQSH